MRNTIAVLLFTLSFSPTLQAQKKAPPPPPPPPTGDVQPPRVIRKSGGVLASEALSKPEPAYPPLARAAKVSGPVVVEITIDEEGKVIAAKALSGHPLLKDSAITAAKQWKFKPTKLSGIPVKVIGTITFNFNLGTPPTDPGNPKSIEALEEDVRKNPNSAQAHYELGTAYYYEKRYVEAEKQFREAVRIDPKNADAHKKLGLALGMLDRDTEAVDEFLEAIRLNPDYAEAYVGLGLSQAMLYRYDDAIKSFDKAIELAPGMADHHFYKGMTYVGMGRDEDAIAAIKKGIEVWPENAEMHYRLGQIYLRVGDKKSAMGEYTALKKLNSELANTLLREINQ